MSLSIWIVSSRRELGVLASSLVVSLALITGIPAAASGSTTQNYAAEPLPIDSSTEIKPDNSSTTTMSLDPIKTLVIGGSTIAISSAPWQVALLDVSVGSDGSRPANQFQAQFCGGSIIHQEWIVTAAHCVTSDDGTGGLTLMNKDNLRILSGTSELSTQALNLQNLQQVSQIIVHPEYQGIEHSDIALIKLSRPLTFVNDRVQPIAISDAKPSQSSRLAVTGWGAVQDTFTSLIFTAQLQEAVQQALSDGICAAAFQAYLASSSLCVGDLEQNRTSSACNGDSGGPVTQMWSNRPRLVGVVSYGSGAGCAKGNPWVAVNVSSFLPWIDSTVSSLSVSGPVYSAVGYRGVNSRVNFTTLTAVNVELKVLEACDHQSSPSGRSTQNGCVTFDPVTEIDSGEIHSCALLESGGVQCWGHNDNGQLGNGTVTESATPVRVSGIRTATAIATGWGRFSCALLESGNVQCWGANTLPDNNGFLVNSSTPVTVPGLSTATAIASGGQHRCALLQGGGVQCWGNNSNGQGGNGTRNGSVTPVSVSGISTATAIAAGSTHTCALLNSGSVKCWGWNSNGQLGNGSQAESLIPVDVSGISNAVAITAGSNHTCALLSNGAVQCWGANGIGQLGNGTKTGSSTPVTASEISSAISISAGWSNTCAVLDGGRVKCWGSNSFGQLGTGTTAEILTPTDVSGVSTATAVSPGLVHTCALFSDAAPKCWGANFFGELGNGTRENSLTPVAVAESLTTTINEYREIANFGMFSSTLQGSNHVIPEVSTNYETNFSQELPGVYELRAIHAETSNLIASAPFIISDGETHSFTLTTDAKNYFPFRDGYLDSILVTASALGQFGEQVPMLDGRAGLRLSSSASTSKSCSLPSLSIGPASCRLSLDQGKYSNSAFVSVSFKDLRRANVNTAATRSAVTIRKTAVSAISVSRDNSTVFPSKDGYRDSAKITIRVNSTLGGDRRISLSKGSKVTIKRGSKVVKSWNLSTSGVRAFTWNGMDGSRIVPGRYQIAVQAIGPEGSKTTTANIEVSGKKLVSVEKTTTYKASSLLRSYVSYDSTACTINTQTGEAVIWTLWFDAWCFGDVPLPKDAKHEYGPISVSASFKVTDNQRFNCFYDTFAIILTGPTSAPRKVICLNGTFKVSGTVDPSRRTVTTGIYVAEFEEFKVKSVTVTFKYKTLK
jgi:alpha-tubulin suppressor-like RCC1 family protein/secreted trypsin-like serine protease